MDGADTSGVSEMCNISPKVIHLFGINIIVETVGTRCTYEFLISI